MSTARTELEIEQSSSDTARGLIHRVACEEHTCGIELACAPTRIRYGRAAKRAAACLVDP